MVTRSNAAGAVALMGAVAALAGCADQAAGQAGDEADAGGAAAVEYVDGVYDGPRVTNIRGGYQAQVTVEGGVISEVAAIEAGTDAPESVEINARAIPELRQKILEAQSADVEHVSGSSFTSPAFLESVQGALDQAAG